MAVINGSYGEREKWVEELFTPKFNCHIPCEGGEGSYKRRKCNTQRRPEYPKVAESQDPKGRRGETLRLIKIVKKEVLDKLKL